jgi:hypothetical protein
MHENNEVEAKSDPIESDFALGVAMQIDSLLASPALQEKATNKKSDKDRRRRLIPRRAPPRAKVST